MPNDNAGQPIVDNDNDLVVIDQNDTEGLKKNLETTLAQKKHWRSKAVNPETGKTWKEEFEAMKTAQAKPPVDPTTNGNVPPKQSDFDAIADSIELVRDLRTDELTELRSVSRELGVDPAKYIKSKAGQAHLKEIRATRKADGAIPGASTRIPTFNGKPVKDILKDDKASPTDKQAAFEARLKGGSLNQSQ